jgi:MFS family permease
MKNYWIYFSASLLSLIGSNYFIFTQGWYLLQLSQERTSVGVTWSLFFLPSLVCLPLIGRLLDSNRLKRLILVCEAAKLTLLLGFHVILQNDPSRAAVYVLACLYGIFFAPYYASVYVMVKRLVPPALQTKYSHYFEVSLQISNIVAIFSSGFIFEKFGFVNLLLLSSFFVLLGLCGMLMFSIEEKQSGPASLFSGYGEIIKLLKRPLSEHGMTKRQFLFGIIHTFPQSVILVGNVALTLYVFDIMKGGPATFGLIDSLGCVAALAVSLIWVRYHRFSEKSEAVILTAVLAGLAVAGTALVPGQGPMPYLWMFLYGALLTSSKILARASIVKIIPKERVGQFSTLFQTTGYAMMMLLFCLVSALSDSIGAAGLFALLGTLLFGYGCLASVLLTPVGLPVRQWVWQRR